MRRLLLALVVLSVAGCFDYDYAVSVCHDAGGCRLIDDAGASDAGDEDAGPGDAGTGEDAGVDAGSPDAGSADASTLEPVFFTSTGWGWEFPFPAGPGLYSLSAVSDDEVWASGEDESVLHFAGGLVTFSRPGTSRRPGELASVLSLPDGGVLVAGPDSIHRRTAQGWSSLVFPYTTKAMELSALGTPWFGVQWQTTSVPNCNPKGGAVVEGYPLARASCTSPVTGDDFVVGFDPEGWALDNSGLVMRREVALDGGVSWPVVARAPAGDYPRCDVLSLSPDDALIAGFHPGRSVMVHLDGGATPFSVTGSPLEEWSSLVRAADQQAFFLGGHSGVARCTGDPVPSCVIEPDGSSMTVEALAHGPSALFAAGSNGQLLRRDADGGWATLHEGGIDALNDVWADPNGELWVAGNAGWLMHRGPSGWERIKASRDFLYSLTRTSDGILWVGGVEVLGYYEPNTRQLVAIDATLPDGGPFALAGSGKAFTYLGGTELGNTWAVSDTMLLRYEGAQVWRSVPFPTTHGTGLDGLFVTDAGTAWVVGGNSSRVVLFWDGARWLDRTPDGGAPNDPLYAVWGPSSNEVFISAEAGGYHFLADGGVEDWNLTKAVTLAGGWMADGGFVVFGGRGIEVQRAPNGVGAVSLPGTNAPRARALNRLRLIGSKLYALGSREDAFSFMLSYDAGL